VPDIQTRVTVGFGSSGANIIVSDLGRIYREVRQGKKTFEAANKEIRNATREIYTMNRAVTASRATWRASNAALLEGMSAMRSLQRVGRTGVAMFQTWTLMQIRAADATRDVRDTEEELTRARELRLRYTKDLGAASVYAQEMARREARLTERLAQERRDLTRAQRDNKVGLLTLGMTALDILPNLVSTYMHIKTTKALLGENWTLTGSLGAIATEAAAAAKAVGTIEMALAALPATVMVTIAIAAEYLSTPEQKRRAKQNITTRQSWVSDVLGGGIPTEPGQPGMEDWVDGLPAWDRPEGSVGGTLKGIVNPWEEPAPRAPRRSTDEYEHRRREAQFTINQTNIIRSADDKTTVDKVADRTLKLLDDRLR